MSKSTILMCLNGHISLVTCGLKKVGGAESCDFPADS